MQEIEVRPVGTCWCGCRAEVRPGAFFQQGHDKIAEAYVTRRVYGSVAAYVARHGYGPGGRNVHEERRGGPFRHLLQLTIRDSDKVNREKVVDKIAELGGKPTGNGFGFASRDDRDNAYAEIATWFGRHVVAVVDAV